MYPLFLLQTNFWILNINLNHFKHSFIIVDTKKLIIMCYSLNISLFVAKSNETVLPTGDFDESIFDIFPGNEGKQT